MYVWRRWRRWAALLPTVQLVIEQVSGHGAELQWRIDMLWDLGRLFGG